MILNEAENQKINRENYADDSESDLEEEKKENDSN